MSIINEAIKKTQLNRKIDKDKRDQVQARPTFDSASVELSTHKPVIKEKILPVQKENLFYIIKMAGFLTITGLLSILGIANYQHVKHSLMPDMQVSNQIQTEQPLSLPRKSSNKEQIAFASVFVSDHTKIAIINKQPYHVGDMLNGMKIVAINEDSVDLQRDDQIIHISAGSTYML